MILCGKRLRLSFKLHTKSRTLEITELSNRLVAELSPIYTDCFQQFL